MKKAYDSYNKADFTKSIEFTRDAMKSISQNDKVAMSDAYSHMAACYQRIGMNDNALNNAFAGLHIDEQLKDNERISASYSNIANIYLAAQRPNEAKTLINKALDLDKNIKKPNTRNLSNRYGMAAEIYLKLNEPDKALDYINRALSIDTIASDSVQIMRRKLTLGDIYASTDSTQKALDNYIQAINMFEKNNDRYNMMLAYKNLGAMYVKIGDKTQAMKWLNLSTEIAKECNAKSVLKENYLLLANILSDNNPSQAAKYLSQSNSLADSIYNDATSKLTSYYAMEFQTKEKELKIEEQQNSITVQRLIITAAIIAVTSLLVLCSALFVIIMLRSRARKAEKNAEQLRDRFFTNVTHEFRTPLTVILGETEELKNEEHDESKRPKYNAIINQGNHLLRLVNQLLNISKVRTAIGSLPWRNGDLAVLVNMIVENMSVHAQRQDTKIDFTRDESDFNIDFVPEYCHSIVTNLISNAIKFDSPNGHITVDMSRKKNNVTIIISDNGCGIKKEDLPHIFDLFFQGSTGKSDLGTGIGLSLVKQMTEAMDGRIEVQSSEGEGSTFTITIPAKHKNREYPKWIPKMITPSVDDYPEPAQKDIEKPSATEMTLSNDDKRIALVVEDNPDVATYIHHVLESSYNVITAHDGEEGLTKAREVIPDIIITDLMMPKVDGLEMCRRLREDELVGHIPIIIVSARDTDKDRLEGLSTGADAYLAKPFKRDELIAVADNLLHTREMLRMKYQAQLTGAEPVKTDKPENTTEMVDTAKILSSIARKNELFIEKVKGVILKNIAKSELNSALIADAMNLSQRQLNRKVNSVLGIDTASCIRQMRILKAQELLLETEDPVGDIGYNCGFESSSYFSKIFRQNTGLTPSDYRKKHRLQ
ncbi:MAG: response regulator [Muribaculaceae bacterium]|nr:response regulator [Muribaculaceae bacterium]